MVTVSRVAFTLCQRRAHAVAKDLEALDESLTAVVGGILQESNRTAGTIVGVATSKLVAAAAMAGTLGGVAAFGVASTGTAITTLSGAAATTATLYWIGSSVGMGVAAGSLMVTGGAIAVGIPAAFLVRRGPLGRRRTEKDLSAPEQAALYAALRLAAAVRAMRPQAMPLVPVEMRLFARQGLLPLASTLNELYAIDRRTDRDDTCVAPSGSLASWPRRRLRRALRRLEGIATKWAQA